MTPSSAPTSAAAGSVIQNGRLHLLEQDADGEGAGRHQPGMAERHLAGVARQQHQGERADAGQEHLVGEVEMERRGEERERRQRDQQAASDARSVRVSISARSCA